MLKWKEEYATGEERIDSQHQSLIRMINDFHNDIRDEKADVDLAIRLLKMYARYHFGYEEECMMRCQCPAHESNKKAHENFIAMVDEFENRAASAVSSTSKQNLARELLHQLFEWLDWHILRTDKQITSCLSK